MSRLRQDEGEELTGYSLWKSENLLPYEGSSARGNHMMAALDALCYDAWWRGRASATRETSNISERLDNIADRTRTLYEKHSEPEKKVETVTQT